MIFNFFKKNKEKERFEKKRKKKEEVVKPLVLGSKKDVDKKNKAVSVASVDLKYSDILVSPHTTEKTTQSGKKGAFIFKVSPKSNKIMIKKAVQELHRVNVVKVNVSKSPSKKRFVRGRIGEKAGYKKAIVYLKKGERIES